MVTRLQASARDDIAGTRDLTEVLLAGHRHHEHTVAGSAAIFRGRGGTSVTDGRCSSPHT